MKDTETALEIFRPGLDRGRGGPGRAACDGWAAAIISAPGRVDKILEVLPELGPLRGMAQGGHHVDDVWGHTLKVLGEFADIARQGLPGPAGQEFRVYLDGHLAPGRPRLPLLQLACLLHDIGKQQCRQHAGGGRYTFYGHHLLGAGMAGRIADRLGLCPQERQALTLLVKMHMAPLFLYLAGTPGRRAAERLFRQGGAELPGVLLLSLADITATRRASGRLEEARAYRDFILRLAGQYYKAVL